MDVPTRGSSDLIQKSDHREETLKTKESWELWSTVKFHRPKVPDKVAGIDWQSNVFEVVDGSSIFSLKFEVNAEHRVDFVLFLGHRRGRKKDIGVCFGRRTSTNASVSVCVWEREREMGSTITDRIACIDHAGLIDHGELISDRRFCVYRWDSEGLAEIFIFSKVKWACLL